MKIKLDMSESDIVKSIRSPTGPSPLVRLAARHFNEDIKNVEVTNDSIVLWDDSINDYHCYRYCIEDIENIITFVDEWADYADGYLNEFTLDPISFCVEQNR